MYFMFWLAAAAVLALIEAFTMGLTTIWFAGASVIAAIAAFFGAPVLAQIMIFLIGSGVLVIFTRPIAKKKLHIGEEKTNLDLILGRDAVVIQEILPQSGGRVRQGGIEWAAVAPEEKEAIPAGETVTICAVEGVKLIVTKKKEV